MTLSSTTNTSGPYNCNGSNQAFTVTFPFLEDDDLHVYLINTTTDETTLLTLTTHYTVTGAGGSSGTVTTVATYASNYRIYIVRDVDFLQETDLQNQATYYPAVLEAALDKVTMQAQELNRRMNRSFTLADYDFSGASTTLPSPSANAVIGWNDDGTALVNYDTIDLTTVATYGSVSCDTFLGDGVTTTYTLSANPGSLNNIRVAINGITQFPTRDFTWDGATGLTFTTAPPAPVVAATDNILVQYHQALPNGVSYSYNINHTQSGTGAVLRNLADKVNDIVNVKDFGATGGGALDDRGAIQAAIDKVYADGGGFVYIPAGEYYLSSAITLKPGVSLFGAGPDATTLTQYGATGISTGSLQWYSYCYVGGFTLNYDRSAPNNAHIGLLVRSGRNNLFQNIRFTNYVDTTGSYVGTDGQIAILLAPDNNVSTQVNCLFNRFDNIYIAGARHGVEYRGVTDSGAFDVDIFTSTAVPANVCVGNVWTGIIMDKISSRGIAGVQWADSEKWFAPYIQVKGQGAICIDLGTDSTNFTQIDQFTIIAPNCEYNSATAAGIRSKFRAIRLGPGAYKHRISDVVTDELWYDTMTAGDIAFDSVTQTIVTDGAVDFSNIDDGDVFTISDTTTNDYTFSADGNATATTITVKNIVDEGTVGSPVNANVRLMDGSNTLFAMTDAYFTAATNRITTKTSNLFLGVSTGTVIHVTGTSDNDGWYTLTGVTGTTMTVAELSTIAKGATTPTITTRDNWFDGELAHSYTLSYGGIGQGSNHCNGMAERGSSSHKVGMSFIATGDTTKTVTFDPTGHAKLRRRPLKREIRLTLFADAGADDKVLSVGAVGDASFVVQIPSAYTHTLYFGWEITLVDF